MTKKKDDQLDEKKAGSKHKPLKAGTVDKIQQDDANEHNPDIDYVIIEAHIKDQNIRYGYQVCEEGDDGDKHKVEFNKEKIVEDSLLQAFGKLNVHLACIDDVFKHTKTEIENINDFHAHELTSLYSVTGFKVKGGQVIESVVLYGNKVISCANGRFEVDTPPVMLDELTSYKWYKELQEVLAECREEVRLYKEGNFTLKEKPEEPESTVTNCNLFDKQDDNSAGENHEEEDFEGKPDPKKLMSKFDEHKVD